MIDGGALHPLTLNFRDTGLEDLFQREAGASGLSGYRIITGATVLLWMMGIFLLPAGSDVPFRLSAAAGGSMALVGSVAFVASTWATTMNRQHFLASMLTSANGLVLLAVATAGDFVEGYAVGAIMLLFLFGTVSRTRFVYAAVRTLVIAAGLGVVIVLYDGPGSLVIDTFFFAAAAIASLMGLRLLEENRRRVWHQRMVIEEQAIAIELERSESERLLLNVLPASVSKRLRNGENPIADEFSDVTVLFADLVGFTSMASRLSASEVAAMLSDLFSKFDELVGERNLEKIKTIGDAYMAVGGLPEPLPDHVHRIVDLALAMLESTRSSEQFPGLSMRIGIHSGPVAGGVIGTRRFAYDVWGNTVNIASRLEKAGVPGRIHVSEEVRTATSGMFEYEPRGALDLRGLGAITTYLLVAPKKVSLGGHAAEGSSQEPIPG